MALIKSVKGLKPSIGEECFLAENATLTGDVKVGNQCSIWFQAVIRGDVGPIVIGNGSNIQDGAVIHATYQKSQVEIGESVSVGHKAILHGCTVKDNALIGMGAIVMDHAVIGKGAVIAAGAVVLAGTKVPDGALYAGVPAKYVKDVSPEMQESLKQTAQRYIEYANWMD